MDNYYVYVLDMNGNPLMPTKRYKWVREALESGKAKAVRNVPFTIRLTYETETKETQEVSVSPDMGRENIGLAAVREDGKCLFRAKCRTRNKEITNLMFERKRHRMASRAGERKARKRLAKRLGTTMKQILKRKLPGYDEGFMTVKDIINTEAKYNNRKRDPGWLTPTARQLLETHKKLIQIITKILPISRICLEYNIFDFVRMENQKVKPWEYGHGPLHGFNGSIMKALTALQGGKCLACGKDEVKHVHHINPVSKGGSDTIGNTAGLCLACHEKLHTVEGFADLVRTKKEGFNKKYHCASVVNQIMSRFTLWCTETFDDVYAIRGWHTKRFREEMKLEKDHDIDAYCMSAMIFDVNKPDTDMPPCYEIKQYRHHDRANIKAQIFRSYYLDGKKIAQNRKPAYSAELAGDGKTITKKQAIPSLQDWFEKAVKTYGQQNAGKMRSKLKVAKSCRRYNDTERVMPGAILIYKGKRYVKRGQLTNGAYFTAEGMPNDFRIPAKDCAVYRNRGLVFVS